VPNRAILGAFLLNEQTVNNRVDAPSVWPSGSTVSITGSATTGATTLTGATAAWQFGTPNVFVSSFPQAQSVGGVASAQSFGVPKVALRFGPGYVPSAQAFGSPIFKIFQALTVGSVPSAQSFGTPAIKTAVTRAVGSVPSAAAFGGGLRTIQTVPVQGLLPYGPLVISTTGSVISGDGHLCGFKGGPQSIIGTPTIKTGPVWVQVAGIPSAQRFGVTLAYVTYLWDSECLDLELAALTCLGEAPVLATFLCGTQAIGASYLTEPLADRELYLQPAGCS